MMARLLFGAPDCWVQRHPNTTLTCLALLVLMAEWLADVAGAAVASLP